MRSIFATLLLLSFATTATSAQEAVFRAQLRSPIFFTQAGPGETPDPGSNPNPSTPTSLALSATPGTWRANDAISFQLGIANGNGNYTVTSSVSGLSYAAGWIAGYLPAGAGPDFSTPFSIHAEDTAGLEGQRDFSIVVLPELVASADAQVAYLGEAFSYSASATGIVGSPTWGLVGGSLTGTGLTHDAGTISGTPTAIGQIPGLVLEVTDSRDQRRDATQPFAIDVQQRSYVATVSTNAVDLDLPSLFAEGVWASSAPKHIDISSILTASSSARAALEVPAFGGTLSISNTGSIRGAAGLGGDNSAGGRGGNAINANGHAFSLANTGSILAGGGGGGAGGKGGAGSAVSGYGNQINIRCEYNRPNGTSIQNISIFNTSGTYLTGFTRPSSSSSFSGENASYSVSCQAAGTPNIVTRDGTGRPTIVTIFPGSDGGRGGLGQGGTGAAGTGGSPSTNTNASKGAAAGGAGGNGAAWAQAGTTGAKGGNGTYLNGSTSTGASGYAGGAAGSAIVGAANLTRTGNGTLTGAVLN